MYLGLDISTSCTGWAVFDAEGFHVKMGYIPLAKHKGLLQKALVVSEHLSKLKETYDIEHVYIEEALQGYRRGLSSAKTISTLLKFNGMCYLLCSQIFNINSNFIHSNAARKRLGIAIKKGIDTKQQVMQWVENDLNGFDWPMKKLQSGPRKGQLVKEKGCDDMADAYVIAKAGIFEQRGIKI